MRQILILLVLLVGFAGYSQSANPHYASEVHTDSLTALEADSIIVKAPLSLRGNKVENVGYPENDPDAANKKYVDDEISGISIDPTLDDVTTNGNTTTNDVIVGDVTGENGTFSGDITITGRSIINNALVLTSGLEAPLSGDSRPHIYRSGSSSGSYPFNSFGNLVYQARSTGDFDHVFMVGSTPEVAAIISEPLTGTGDDIIYANSSGRLTRSSVEIGDIENTTSGTFAATASNLSASLSSVTFERFLYTRVNDVITWSARCSITSTSTGSGSFSFAIPVGSGDLLDVIANGIENDEEMTATAETFGTGNIEVLLEISTTGSGQILHITGQYVLN